MTKITCPKCGHVQDVEIPGDKCLAFYKCEGCGQIIPPKKRDCCVVCSFSDKKCAVSEK